MTDEEILEMLPVDPQSGIALVMDKHGSQLMGRLEAYARRKSYGNAYVEDVFQDAVLRLLKPENRETCLKHGGAILPWLTWWGKHRLDDVWRSQDRAGIGTSPDDLPDDSAELVQDFSDENFHDLLLLERAREQLSPRDREILQLRYHESYSNAELASRLGISEVAAKKASHDARRRLEALLTTAGFEP